MEGNLLLMWFKKVLAHFYTVSSFDGIRDSGRVERFERLPVQLIALMNFKEPKLQIPVLALTCSVYI